MATLGGLPVGRIAGVLQMGAAFPVSPTPNFSRLRAIDGWRVEVLQDVPYIAVSRPQAASRNDSLETSYEAAQRFLDVWAYETSYPGRLDGFDREHLVWWNDGQRQTLRVVSNTVVGIEVRYSYQVKDAAGNVKETGPKATTATWTESLGYYRQSQATEDIFDSYRNLWLALENALSSIQPRRAKEREVDWLERALVFVQQQSSLGPFTSTGVNDAKQLVQELYKDVRVQIFHAKSGEPIRRIHSLSDRELVRSRLEALGGLYIEVAIRHLGLQRPVSAFTNAGFTAMMSWMKELCATLITAKDAALDSAETSHSSVWEGALEFPAAHDETLSKPGYESVLSIATPATVPPFRRFGLKLLAANGREEALYFAHRFEVELEPSGLDALEIQQGCYLNNTGLAIKKHFRT